MPMMPRLVVMTKQEQARMQLKGLYVERQLLDTMTGLLAAMMDLQTGKHRVLAFPWDAWMTTARGAVEQARWVLRQMPPKPTPQRRLKRKPNKKGAA